MSILGLHHITLICSDAQQTVDFYTRVLGLRFVKKTVNFDDPGSYHLYFGDETGRPGTAITFFEWPDAPRGHSGIGGTHHFALTVEDVNGLLKWKRRLNDLSIAVQLPTDQRFFASIFFNDPDGTVLEIATRGPGFNSIAHPDTHDQAYLQSKTWRDPVPEITSDMALMHGMHHITAISSNIERTNAFYSGLLGMQRVKQVTDLENPKSAQWYWGVDEGRPGTLITYIERDPHQVTRAEFGAGQTHHFALAVADESTQLEWRKKLVRAGLPVSPVMDRIYFKSIYTRDPDGHIVELATAGPGFAIDEPVAELGTHLKLPPWLESHRNQIEANLTPIQIPARHSLEQA